MQRLIAVMHYNRVLRFQKILYNCIKITQIGIYSDNEYFGDKYNNFGCSKKKGRLVL